MVPSPFLIRGDYGVIKLHRLNGTELYLNPDHIEIIEETPNTVITLTNGHRYLVKENIDEIIELIVEFKGKFLTRRSNDMEEVKG